MPETPEDKARLVIDAKLVDAGWIVQDRDDLDLTAGTGIAVRQFAMKSGHGFADYLLYIERKDCGAIEAKAAGTLSGVEAQSAKYSTGLPDNLPAHRRPLPFLFESNGKVIYFTNGLDPKPRSRQVFNFLRPETIVEWLDEPATLRARFLGLPSVDETGLWKKQIIAINKLEESLKAARPRALIQMATGSGKTFTAANAAYRLLKFAGAKRILFLVDRGNLGKQTEDEFANFTPPDDTRKFPTLYTVQRLKNNSINPAAKVVITTIQRLYSMLKGDVEFDATNEEGSSFDTAKPWKGEPPDVEYNTAIPPEFFDVVIVDECHRSIYELWAQVLLYFDAFLVGLTATPAGKTIGFFNKKLVMQYSHDEAVVDGVNVNFDVSIDDAADAPADSISFGFTIGSKTRRPPRNGSKRRRTSLPMRPKPTTPTVISRRVFTSGRGTARPHCPPRTRPQLGTTCRVAARMNASVWSATSSMQ